LPTSQRHKFAHCLKALKDNDHATADGSFFLAGP